MVGGGQEAHGGGGGRQSGSGVCRASRRRRPNIGKYLTRLVERRLWPRARPTSARGISIDAEG